jgi:hypothetical protein
VRAEEAVFSSDGGIEAAGSLHLRRAEPWGLKRKHPLRYGCTGRRASGWDTRNLTALAARRLTSALQRRILAGGKVPRRRGEQV